MLLFPGCARHDMPHMRKCYSALSVKARFDMAETRRRPYKICNSERTKTTGIVVESLEELKEKAAPKLGITVASCRVFLERDGTEVDDEEYFGFLEDQTKFMIVSDGDEWTVGSLGKEILQA